MNREQIEHMTVGDVESALTRVLVRQRFVLARRELVAARRALQHAHDDYDAARAAMHRLG